MKPNYEKLPRLIELMSEYRYLIILSIFVTYTDLFLVHAFGFGLLNLQVDLINVISNLVWVFIYVFLLSFYLAIIVPALVQILRYFWVWMPGGIYAFVNKRSFKEHEFKAKSNDYKRYTELVKEALSEKNSIKLNLVQELKTNQNKSKKHGDQVSIFCFALITLMLIGLVTIDQNQTSLIQWSFDNLFTNYKNSTIFDKFIFVISWYFFFVLIYIGVWHQIIIDKGHMNYIYFPYENSRKTEIKRHEPNFD